MAEASEHMTSRRSDGRREMDDSTRHVRGSSVLLVGKVTSLAIGLATQILLVRYLSKSDYGAWGYALAVIAFFQTICTLGLARSQTRFIPIYHEKQEFDKLFGIVALMVITILSTSALIICATYLAPDFIASLVSGNTEPVTLLFVMIFLVPVQAVDSVFEGLFASFLNPRAIFVRKYILGPSLKLFVVLLLISFESTVIFVAYGYLAAAAIGLTIYCGAFYSMAKNEGLLEKFSLKNITIPAAEVFAFTIPLMTSDLLSVLMHTTDTLFLGYFHDTEAIASYQAILPTVRINVMVMTSFSLLFTPIASRLFARQDTGGINELYWRTAIWLAVLTFPMFVLTFSLAEPLTVLLFGDRYSDSWVYLSILGFAYYCSAALGFNGVTLKVIGKVRYILALNGAIAVVNVVGNLALIPRYGALGATLATAGSMMLHNVLKQVGLKYLGHLQMFERNYLSIYCMIFAAGIGLFLLQLLAKPNAVLMFAVAALVVFAVLRHSQEKLDIESTFPEVSKIPLAKHVLGINRPKADEGNSGSR